MSSGYEQPAAYRWLLSPWFGRSVLLLLAGVWIASMVQGDAWASGSSGLLLGTFSMREAHDFGRRRRGR